MAFLANDDYKASLRQTWIAPDSPTLAVTAIPTNLPTIITANHKQDTQTKFAVTGVSGDSPSNYALTGVTVLSGGAENLPEGTPLDSVVHEDFFNQYSNIIETVSEITDTGSVLLPQIATPTTPDFQKHRLYFKSDGRLYAIDDAGVERYISNYNTTSLYQNAIINSNFDIWQRGTSFTATDYTADRWRLALGTGASATLSRQSFTLGQTDVPHEPTYFLRLNRTTTGSTATTLEQRVEDVRTFAGRSCTLSFWAKAGSAISITTSATQHFGTGGSPSANVDTAGGTHSITTSWQKFTHTFTIPSISGKTLGTTINNYLSFIFTMPTTAGTVALDIAQVTVNEGTTALEFQPKSFEDELRACQRYCRAYFTTQASERIAFGFVTTSTTAEFFFPFDTPMRTPPTLIATASDWKVTNSGISAVDCTAITITNVANQGVTGGSVRGSVASGLTPGYSADLEGDGTVGRLLYFTAEL